MPFQDLEDRIVRKRDKFGLTIGGKGEITIWFPTGHALTQVKRVKTKVGTGEDHGRIILIPMTDKTGRAVNKSSNKKTFYVRYATLPGAPKGKLRMVDLLDKNIPDGHGAIMLTLPWYKPKLDFSDQNVKPKAAPAPVSNVQVKPSPANREAAAFAFNRSRG